MSESHSDEEENEHLVPFKVIRENWNVFEVQDGSIIKTKIVLINLTKKPEKTKKGELMGFGIHNVVGVFSPEKIRGPKDRNYSLGELENFVSEKNLMFRRIEGGDDNEYETEKLIIRVANKVSQIDKTSKFDSSGMPSYIIRSNTDFLVLNKETAKAGAPEERGEKP